MDEYLKIGAITGSTIRDFWYAREFRLHNLDIFLYFASFALDTDGIISHSSATIDKSTWRTAVKNVPSFLDGLAMFVEILNTNELSRDKPMSNWRPRDTFSLSGVSFPGAHLYNGQLSDMFTFEDVSQNNLQFDIMSTDIYPNGSYYLSADMFFDIVARINSPEAGFKKSVRLITNLTTNLGQSWGGIVSKLTAEYSIVKHTFSELLYSVRHTIDAFNLPQGAVGWTSSYSVTIARDKLKPWTICVQVSDDVTVFVEYDVPLYQQTSFHPSGTARQGSSFIVVSGSSAFADLKARAPFSIMCSTPALYHTQSRAYAKLLHLVSRNFESLMESPEFLPLIWEAVSLFSSRSNSSFRPFGLEGAGSISTKVPIVEGAKNLVRLLCGGYLAYIFAIAPTLKSAKDVYETFLGEVSQATGEASIVYNGVAADFGNLPVGIRNQLASISDEEVIRYELRYRSQILQEVTRPKSISIINALIDDASRFGFELDPTYLWKAVPFTFVFDAGILPLGALLESAYNRYKLIGMRSTTYGHSLSIRISYRNGNRFHCYIRSDPTTQFIDPPRDLWLQSPGLSIGTMVPLALSLLI